MFVVVLTGGIASGKTAVSDLFAELDVPVIDTDVIAHQLVQPGEPALDRIQEEFGPDYIDNEGRLDRKKMRHAIFAEPELKSRLERILHPAIGAEASRQISIQHKPWCLLVIPLFAESDQYDWIDRVLVIDVDEATQIERVMARDDISKSQAIAILRAQASRQSRLALADDVIDNSGTLDELRTSVYQLYKKYSALAVSN